MGPLEHERGNKNTKTKIIKYIYIKYNMCYDVQLINYLLSQHNRKLNLEKWDIIIII